MTDTLRSIFIFRFAFTFIAPSSWHIIDRNLLHNGYGEKERGRKMEKKTKLIIYPSYAPCAQPIFGQESFSSFFTYMLCDIFRPINISSKRFCDRPVDGFLCMHRKWKWMMKVYRERVFSLHICNEEKGWFQLNAF